MKYELAKKLKDAGFTQIAGDGRWIYNYEGSPEMYYPSLSELIGACGDRFESLTKMNKETWQASAYVPDGMIGVPGGLEAYKKSLDYNTHSGSTPEEAVAQLYLSLNGKLNK